MRHYRLTALPIVTGYALLVLEEPAAALTMVTAGFVWLYGLHVYAVQEAEEYATP